MIWTITIAVLTLMLVLLLLARLIRTEWRENTRIIEPGRHRTMVSHVVEHPDGTITLTLKVKGGGELKLYLEPIEDDQ